jgi:predicted  nucleic acid-binding Zn-ribbon protein
MLTSLHSAPVPEELLLAALAGSGLAAQSAATNEQSRTEAAWHALRELLSCHPLQATDSRLHEARAATTSDMTVATLQLDVLAACIESGIATAGLVRPGTDLFAPADAMGRNDVAEALPAVPPLPAVAEAARQLFLEPDGMTPMYLRHHAGLGRALLLRAVEATVVLLETLSMAADATVASAMPGSARASLPVNAAADVSVSVSLAAVVRMAFLLSVVMKFAHDLASRPLPLSGWSPVELGTLTDAALTALLLLVRPRFHLTGLHEFRARYGAAFTSSPSTLPTVASAASTQGDSSDGATSIACIAMLAALNCVGSCAAVTTDPSAAPSNARRGTRLSGHRDEDAPCLFARQPRGGDDGEELESERRLSRAASSASLSNASTTGVPNRRLRDFLICVCLEGRSGVWVDRVDVISLLARLMLGAPGASAASPFQGAGPDRRAAAVFGGNSLHATMDILYNWVRQCEATLLQGASSAASLKGLRPQGAFAVAPALGDIMTNAMTCGIAREWPNAVPCVVALASAFAMKRRLAVPTSAAEVGDGDGAATRRVESRGVSFVNSRPPTQPAVGRPSARVADDSDEPTTHCAERLAVAPIVLPALIAVLSGTGACRAVITGASTADSLPLERGDGAQEQFRGSAVSALLPLLCFDVRLLGLYGGRSCAVKLCQFYDRWSCDTNPGGSASASLAAADSSASATLSTFRLTCRAIAACCGGTSSLPAVVYRFLMPALLHQQASHDLPRAVQRPQESLAYRAANAERWVVLAAAGYLARCNPSLRSAICNLTGPSTMLSANAALRDENKQQGASPAWHSVAYAAAVSASVGFGATSVPSRNSRGPALVALQPLHVAPEQRAVAHRFAAVAAAAAAGLVTRRVARTRGDEHDDTLGEAVTDDGECDTDEEDELVLVDKPGEPAERRRRALVDADDVATEVSTARSQGRPDSRADDGATAFWTPLMAQHWLCDSAVRWACRARLYAERDVLVASVSPTMRSHIVGELLALLQFGWMPVSASLPQPQEAPAPWYRSTDALVGRAVGAPAAGGPLSRHHVFEKRALSPVITAAVSDVAAAVCGVFGDGSDAALLCLAAPLSRHTGALTMTTPSDLHVAATPQTGKLVIDRSPGRSDLDGASAHNSGAGSVTTLTQRAGGSQWGRASGDGTAGTSRKQRSAMIEQLTEERNQLREELTTTGEDLRVAESRLARVSAERDDLEQLVEQQYVRVIALANAVTATRQQEADVQAVSSNTFSMLERERDGHDATKRRLADVQDELHSARDAIHGLEARLVGDRRAAEEQLRRHEEDEVAMARRIEDLDGALRDRARHIASLEAKLEAFQKLSSAIGGLAEQMR